ncbi:MAG: exosortase V [Sphingobium sp.]|nr:exosortase V [Sphingobium sp.]
MTERSEISPVQWLLQNPVLIAGMLAIFIPTILFVAQDSWSTEQGAHGPIVLATGLWLLAREWKYARPSIKPAPLLWVAVVFVPLLALYYVSRVSAIVETEGYLMYSLLIVVLYSFIGWRALLVLWFPLFYLLFLFPPPETLVAAVTNPLKIALSEWSVHFLYLLGYPIAQQGVTIQIGQYQLFVADACSGLNSLISLSAISLFYVYLRHRANFRYSMILFVTVVPVAIFANFVRIMFLVLLTYYGGEAVAQGFLHQFAGMTTFMTALLTIFLIDHFIGTVWPGLKTGGKPPIAPPLAGPRPQEG